MLPNTSPSLSKTDFMLFLDCPRHFWAYTQGLIPAGLDAFSSFLAEEGKDVEALALDYLRQNVLPQYPGAHLLTQAQFSDGPFNTRADALLCGLQGGGCALFEIKSSTSVDKANIYDATFQALIVEHSCDLRQVYILHLNKDYTRGQSLELDQLFKCTQVLPDPQIRDQVQIWRQQALNLLHNPDLNATEPCYDPGNCPCPQLCHPNLPEFSFFNLPRLGKPLKKQLWAAGQIAVADLPEDLKLNDKQATVLRALRANAPQINTASLRQQLESLSWPLYFLDYETFPAALPMFPGYRPHQQAVFQYSLHKLNAPDAPAEHFEAVFLGPDEPSAALAASLRAHLGPSGSVIVWNQTFEMTRNRELALLHPQHAAFFEDLNERVFDLMKLVEDGHYVHPQFLGKHSIKKVLPVMVPELSYAALAIQDGNGAITAWQRSCDPDLRPQDRDAIRKDLLAYCHLDSLAMLEIYRQMRALAGL